MANKKLMIFQWVIILVVFIFNILLIFQNLNLKNSFLLNNEQHGRFKAWKFESDLKENLLFQNFPIQIKIEDFFFNDKQKLDNTKMYLIMVFDLTVCGKCLHEELAILNLFNEELNKKQISILGIIGISSKSEEAEIIKLQKLGAITFPFKTMEVNSLYEVFGLNKENFLDTPFFVFTNVNFYVLDIFKPVYLKTEELKKWLKIIIKQDISTKPL